MSLPPPKQSIKLQKNHLKGGNIESIIYTPDEVSQLGIDNAEWVRDHAHNTLAFPVAGLDKYVAPLIPGTLFVLQAQTSNYKSGFFHFWEDHAARQLVEIGRENGIIIHVSVEETIEEMAQQQLARESRQDAGNISIGKVEDWEGLRIAAVRMSGIPIYRIGESFTKSSKGKVALHLSNVQKAVEYLRDRLLTQKLEIAAIFVDYLQALPYDNEIKSVAPIQRRKEQVKADIYRLREMAIQFACPVVVASQAKTKLESAPNTTIHLPGLYDASEAKDIADRTNKLISLWMPKMHYPVGTWIEIDKNSGFQVEENTLLIWVIKQRGPWPSGRFFLCNIDFRTNIIRQVITV